MWFFGGFFTPRSQQILMTYGGIIPRQIAGHGSAVDNVVNQQVFTEPKETPAAANKPGSRGDQSVGKIIQDYGYLVEEVCRSSCELL